jgi:hypothetical protein
VIGAARVVEARELYGRSLQRQGLDPADIENKLREFDDKGLVAGVAGRVARGDFEGARELVQGFYARGVAPGPDYAEASQTASGFLTSRAGAEKAEAVSGVSGGGGLIMPLAGDPRISSPFGPRRAPETPKGKGSSNHQGIDYAVPVGTPIMAAGAGKVVFVGDKGGYGKQVVIDHGGGRETWYSHLDDFAGLKVGQTVNQGDLIAHSGNTGKSTGPHLDFKIKEGDRFVDPAEALSGRSGGGGVNKQAADLLATIDKAEKAAVKEANYKIGNEIYQVGKKAFYDSPEAFEAADANMRKLIAEIPDHDQRNQFEKQWDSDRDGLVKLRDANDRVATTAFLEQARKNHWLKTDMQAAVDKVEGLSPAGKVKLKKQIGEDMVNKDTPENRAALSELRALLDSGDLFTAYPNLSPEEAIEAYAARNNLTTGQINAAHKYFDEGGAAGRVTQTEVTRAFKALNPKKKEVPADLFDLVTKSLLPGENPKDPRVMKRLVANLLMEGESEGQTSFSYAGYGKDETYAQALKAGRASGWLPEVTKEEKAGLVAEMAAKGLTEISDITIREYKRLYKLRIPGYVASD